MAVKNDSQPNNSDQIAENPASNGNTLPLSQQEKSTLDQLEFSAGDKIVLTEHDCYEELGFCFPSWKKWTIITIIFFVQVSMNFNTSLYSNALGGISEEFGVSMQAARCGAMVYLVTYAFGCELWAPWSEELGRMLH